MDKKTNYPVIPLRTFVVQRQFDSGDDSDERIKEGVEATRYYVDSVGTLCFELLTYNADYHTITTHLPKSMAAGTWYDVTETTAEFTVRPVQQVS